tara:strand:+ start:847 stop:1473 length:627 start_codon:yes stop_codon:yes gene_type:complete
MSDVFDKVKNSDGMSREDFKKGYYAQADSLWKAENIEFSGEIDPDFKMQMFDVTTGSYDSEYIKAIEAAGGSGGWPVGNIRGQYYDNLQNEMLRKRSSELNDPVWAHNFKLDMQVGNVSQKVFDVDRSGQMYTQEDGTPMSPYEVHDIISNRFVPYFLKQKNLTPDTASKWDIRKAEDKAFKYWNEEIESGTIKIVPKPHHKQVYESK